MAGFSIPYRLLHLLTVFSVGFVFFFHTFSISAQTVNGDETVPEHYTVVISQVRGTECCSPGSLTALENQIATAESNDLPLTLAVRYDALQDPEYVAVLRSARSAGMEIGAFLEITPQLASESGVTYTGTPENWYEAQHVYLVGYAPEDRIKIIDQYMSVFERTFGETPTLTNAWIIDTPSLQYLTEEYGVQAHEITREQWGTDSYTMWGGPPHFPYSPSEKWAFVPASSPSAKMPLIMRQTISDPVWNYGDTTNSYTSQPNDYRIKERGFDYFRHVFTQAHTQSEQPLTFALLGLENSMPEIDQQEFARQLNFVGEWKKHNEHAVVTATEFSQVMSSTDLPSVTIHHGADKLTGSDNQAWWVTTPTYRARVRLSDQTLYISDLRVYGEHMFDPYTTRTAKSLAYWVVPFTLDGARFWQKDTQNQFHPPHTDQLSPREAKYGQPTRIVLAENISADELTVRRQENNQITFALHGEPLLQFAPDHWQTHRDPQSKLGPLADLLTEWQWTDSNGNFVWGFTPSQENGHTNWYPFIHAAGLEQEREMRYPYIFPELAERELDTAKTHTVVTNAFAQAGRNPIRLAFFPRDWYDYPTLIEDFPDISVDSDSVHIEQTKPSNQNGLVFIDLTSGEVQRTTVTVTYENYSSTHTITFAPNCRREIRLCLQHPRYWKWYFQNWFGDKYRQWQEQKNNS
ncbi:hypothetical protein LRY65_00030 [Candidatus Woesebacteria bacterium]|nr:hypothetical protein [Candidatus Woesebacteria bacterium]MCD8507271.1 hypothetical protein [Candidatus Woesebacteria bacterium]MCD8526595.1 hypothetical protein [Candidatus Woesebacteria bacterium]MCD8545988.1 hypothetical protein [Candidatus Woesebacteria bacterium]